MKIKTITNALEELAPKNYAEDFDNVGLLIGSYEQNVEKILITLDVTEEVIQEAINEFCQLIITFHPIFFNSIKRIIGYSKDERIAVIAIKNNISIYAIHTNLDNILYGTNYQISNYLELINKKILIPKFGTIKKLTTYVPKDYVNKVRNALFSAGAGNIGNYDQCSYNFDGIGSFRGNKNSQSIFGKKNQLNLQEETCINVIFQTHQEKHIKKILFENHPYEEVAYEIYDIRNSNRYIGIGIVGELKNPMSEIKFLNFLKEKMHLSHIRHSPFLNKNIQKIAFISGSGSFGLSYAKKEDVDLFLSCDFKYHHFFESNKQMLIVDIEHYECEQFTKEILYTYLNQKFPNFAIIQSGINTNPICYF